MFTATLFTAKEKPPKYPSTIEWIKCRMVNYTSMEKHKALWQAATWVFHINMPLSYRSQTHTQNNTCGMRPLICNWKTGKTMLIAVRIVGTFGGGEVEEGGESPSGAWKCFTSWLSCYLLDLNKHKVFGVDPWFESLTLSAKGQQDALLPHSKHEEREGICLFPPKFSCTHWCWPVK